MEGSNPCLLRLWNWQAGFLPLAPAGEAHTYTLITKVHKDVVIKLNHGTNSSQSLHHH